MHPTGHFEAQPHWNKSEPSGTNQGQWDGSGPVGQSRAQGTYHRTPQDGSGPAG